MIHSCSVSNKRPIIAALASSGSPDLSSICNFSIYMMVNRRWDMFAGTGSTTIQFSCATGIALFPSPSQRPSVILLVAIRYDPVKIIDHIRQLAVSCL